MRTPFERVCLTTWTLSVIVGAWWLMAGMPSLTAVSQIARVVVSYKLFGKL